MEDTDRVLGALQEFKAHTMSRLDRLENKLDELQSFRWRIMGGAAVISAAIPLLFEYIRSTN